MKRSYYCRALVAASASLLMAQSSDARAELVTAPGTFSGPAQTAHYDISSNSGSFTVSGSGQLGGQPVLLTPNPQTRALSIVPNPTIGSSHPTGTVAKLTLDNQTGALVSFDGLDLNLVGATPIPLAIVPTSLEVTVGGEPVALPVTATITAKAITFTSDAIDFFGDEFSLVGTASAIVDASVSVAGIPVLEISDGFLPGVDVFVQGTMSSSVLPGATPRDVKISLDGFGETQVSYNVSPTAFSFDTDTVSFSGTVAYGFKLLYQADFHLETVVPAVVVPEPSSVMLLGVGVFLSAVSAALRRR